MRREATIINSWKRDKQHPADIYPNNSKLIINLKEEKSRICSGCIQTDFTFLNVIAYIQDNY